MAEAMTVLINVERVLKLGAYNTAHITVVSDPEILSNTQQCSCSSSIAIAAIDEVAASMLAASKKTSGTLTVPAEVV